MNHKKITEFNKHHVCIAVSKNSYGRCYHAKKNFKRGEVVLMTFGNVLTDHQTKHISVQIGANKHFLPSPWTGRFLNHSCAPNCCIQTRSDGFPDVVALRAIKKGEEITFGYYMTEHEWAPGSHENIARCLCGAKKCRGKILSFSELSAKEKKQNKMLVSSYLKKKVA
jgi:hypothetical protein